MGGVAGLMREYKASKVGSIPTIVTYSKGHEKRVKENKSIRREHNLREENPKDSMLAPPY